ncbi:ABC transporter ATP-binding protein [Mangrovicella endophytica]|uniref:ABC transporter ATP-binding protein n=1 Tax=Mangrovicella endophytica TaxID=2066697 RepID=UPI0018E46E45|nr:ABC transporter ATP-binding protein [Mangrovicella endophytica]
MSPLLSVRSLAVALSRPDGAMRPILSDIDFDLAAGETLGLVGESGSGKSLLALTLIGLLPSNAAVSGTILFDGRDITQLSEPERLKLRGREIAMVFQEPGTALNPAMRIGDQIAEGLVLLDGVSATDARRQALHLLDRVRIADAGTRIDDYPHQLSGGQRQRVMIAIALARSPKLLIADEPTTALDAAVRRTILDTLAELVAERSMALLLVSHDLGMIARATRRLLVLYGGTVFESGETAEVIGLPANPYTQALLAAAPRPWISPAVGGRRPRLPAIPGRAASAVRGMPGCRFADRCAYRIDACEAAEPALRHFGNGDRRVRCIRAEEVAAAP